MGHPRFKLASYLPPEVGIPFLLYFVHSLIFGLWIIDDAAISLAFGRNLVHGHGLIAQTGAQPVEGFSNPLWTFLTAPLMLDEPVDPTGRLKTLSWFLVLGMFVTIGRLLRNVLGEHGGRVATLPAGTALAMSPSFVIWTTSGLENPLYALLVALSALVLIHYVHRRENGLQARNHSLGLGIIAACLCLTRPDGLLFLICLPAASLLLIFRGTSSWKLELPSLAWFAVAWLGPWGSYLLFRYSYFGDIYPNTYYAKGGPGASAVLDLLLLRGRARTDTMELLYSLVGSWAPWVGILAAALVLHRLLRWRYGRSLYLLPFWLCGWAIQCLLPRDWMGEFRFATPFFLMFFVFLSAATAEILERRVSMRVSWALSGLLVLAWLPLYLPRSTAFIEEPPASFEVISGNAHRFNCYAEHLGIADASILVPDLGGQLYFSNHQVVDLAGLCDRKLAELITQQDNRPLRSYVIEELQPTFIHTHSYWASKSNLHNDRRFRALYVPLRVEWHEAYPGIPDGDYVLRPAIQDPESLQRFHASGGAASCRDLPERPEPFPRK